MKSFPSMATKDNGRVKEETCSATQMNGKAEGYLKLSYIQ